MLKEINWAPPTHHNRLEIPSQLSFTWYTAKRGATTVQVSVGAIEVLIALFLRYQLHFFHQAGYKDLTL